MADNDPDNQEPTENAKVLTDGEDGDTTTQQGETNQAEAESMPTLSDEALDLKPKDPQISIRYDLDDEGRVAAVVGEANGDWRCAAIINDQDPGYYDYWSQLEDGKPVKSNRLLSLANAVLAMNVHLGLIPPMEFEIIACRNKH